LVVTTCPDRVFRGRHPRREGRRDRDGARPVRDERVHELSRMLAGLTGSGRRHPRGAPGDRLDIPRRPSVLTAGQPPTWVARPP
jgi:hypothetical protein